MTGENKMQISFISRSSNEGFARIAVSGFLAQLDPTVDELAEIKTVVSEAVTNCIVHGYQNTLGMIYITVKFNDAGEVSITIRDKGCGIEDVEKAMQPLFTTCNTGERAGMGLPLWRAFPTGSKSTPSRAGARGSSYGASCPAGGGRSAKRHERRRDRPRAVHTG